MSWRGRYCRKISEGFQVFAPINAEPGNNRAIPRAIGKHTAEAGGRTLIDHAPRVSVAVFFAIAFGGMLIWGIKKEIAQIDSHLLVLALRATPTSSLVAALAATALSYLALVGYDVSGFAVRACASAWVIALVWVPSQAEPYGEAAERGEHDCL